MKSGEPEFLAEDTDGAIALEEEERDTCPSCGMPKVWCRDPANQFAFEAFGEQCHVTYVLEAHRGASNDDATQTAIQTGARFREGFEPDLKAGLDLSDVEVD